MNKLWHFGDSFGTCGSEEVIFSKYISYHLNLELEHKSVGGYSNSKIFSEILSYNDVFNSEDVILVNWSYHYRMDIVFKEEITSWLNIEHDNEILELANPDLFFKYKNYIIDQHLNWNYDNVVKLFKGFVVPYFKTLINKDIKIYNVFLSQINCLNLDGILLQKDLDFISIPGKSLKFEPNYHDWLINQNWLKEESVHYPFNIQLELSKEYIKRF